METVTACKSLADSLRLALAYRRRGFSVRILQDHLGGFWVAASESQEETQVRAPNVR